ncbi:hypothetical protein HHL23_05590 [Chryseobacterium sp. RP-3-3]|uniref:Uncharacterized protein n=1 Tax=Chryseobacterium antibioticum TaxID=2728847 RepID=A0A7Y0AL05_9FLAO|nr:hypothetical protein [Chryseobacterium antibioticum]NML69265.1 hypothetical protein [Chryseobacterium antibioticum]
MEIENICNAIRKWNTLTELYKMGNKVSEQEILNALNQGTHFSVTGKEINEWRRYLEHEDNKAIHAYAGIDEGLLKFFLIDSKSDADADFSHILVKKFTRGSVDPLQRYFSETLEAPSIDWESAINRNFRWNMFGSTWLEVNREKPFFRLISIPFSDYEKLGLEEDQACICFLGLTTLLKDGGSLSDYHIEFITVKHLEVNEVSNKAEDFSTPRPPFSISGLQNFQLLIKSDGNI